MINAVDVTQHGLYHNELSKRFRVDIMRMRWIREAASSHFGIRKVSLQRVHTGCMFPPPVRSCVAFLDVFKPMNKRLHWHISLDIMSVLAIEVLICKRDSEYIQRWRCMNRTTHILNGKRKKHTTMVRNQLMSASPLTTWASQPTLSSYHQPRERTVRTERH